MNDHVSSIYKRLSGTIVASVIRGLTNLVIGLWLARWLGPNDYGRLAYLTGLFSSVRQLLDLGTSSAFFTFLSQNQPTSFFVNSYYLFLAFQYCICLVIIELVNRTSAGSKIWLGEESEIVQLAFTAVFFQGTVWSVVQQAAESQRRTIWIQCISVGTSLVHASSLFVLFKFLKFGIEKIFAVQSILYLIASLISQVGFKYINDIGSLKLRERVVEIWKKYWRYCQPLVFYSIVSFGYDFLDRWMLQTFSGSTEQAYYLISTQFSSVALVATVSILKIFWKEIAEANKTGNLQRIKILYRRVSRTLFLTGSTLACFLSPWSTEIVKIVYGENYSQSSSTMAIMFFYPIHQSMGQIVGIMLLATEKVNAKVRIGLVFMIISMIASYILVAPPSALVPGMGLGAIGLAIKMCAMQVLQVNIIAYYIAKEWKFEFEWKYQITTICCLLFLGFSTKLCVSFVISQHLPSVLSMLISGFIYLIATFIIIQKSPNVFGINSDDLEFIKKRFNKYKSVSIS